MSRPLREVPCAPTLAPAVLEELLTALGHALAGTGPALALVDEGAAPSAASAPVRVPDDVCVVVRTSGSTGEPRSVLLTAEALRASADATAGRLSGHGRWVLALPVSHVAGLQVLVRSLLAGTRPSVLPAGPFRPAGFIEAVDRMSAGAPRYVSLVPTQLGRLLQDDPAVERLRRFDAVLLGGAASSAGLLESARGAGVGVVTTYGMSETCGGCVYDGVPLDGVRVGLGADDRIRLTGPVLASGYLGSDEAGPAGAAAAFVVEDGVRTFITSDIGAWHGGRLVVLGRADDMIVTGGLKVAPAAVESALAALPGVADVCVVGVPDPEWGQAVVAVLVRAEGALTTDLPTARAAVSARLGAAHAPRHLLEVAQLPRRGPGKTDRRAVAALAAHQLGRPLHARQTPTPVRSTP